MAILTKGVTSAQFIVSEASGNRSREAVTVTVPANTTYSAGTIMGQITASSKYVRHAAGASDGSETEAGVLLMNLVNTTGSGADFDGVIIARDAEVRESDLTYEVGADASQETTSQAALATLGIITRT